MVKELTCATCGKPISFIYSPDDSGVGVFGTVSSADDSDDSGKKTVIAYLKCEEGHEHPYEVEI